MTGTDPTKARLEEVMAGTARKLGCTVYIPERAFLAAAAMGIGILVTFIGLLVAGPADPVTAGVLQALNGFHPAAVHAGDLARADRSPMASGRAAWSADR